VDSSREDRLRTPSTNGPPRRTQGHELIRLVSASGSSHSQWLGPVLSAAKKLVMITAQQAAQHRLWEESARLVGLDATSA